MLTWRSLRIGVGIGFLLVASVSFPQSRPAEPAVRLLSPEPAAVVKYSDPTILRGLRTVEVVIERLDSDISATGLDEAKMRTDVELKLRLCGLVVLTQKEASHWPVAVPWLYVQLSGVPLRQPKGFAWAVTFGLEENARLDRMPESRAYGVMTWECGAVGVFGGAEPSNLRSPIKDAADKFCNDWLAANPKR